MSQPLDYHGASDAASLVGQALDRIDNTLEEIQDSIESHSQSDTALRAQCAMGLFVTLVGTAAKVGLVIHPPMDECDDLARHAWELAHQFVLAQRHVPSTILRREP